MTTYHCEQSKEDFCNGDFSDFSKRVTTYLTNDDTGEVVGAKLCFTYKGDLLVDRFWDIGKSQDTVKFEDVVYNS